MNKENLANILQNVFEKELELDKVTVENLQINSLHRMGEDNSRRKFPRPVFVQFANKMFKDIVMSQVSVLKEKKTKIRIASHQPEEVRENGKSCTRYNRTIQQRILQRKLKVIN